MGPTHPAPQSPDRPLSSPLLQVAGWVLRQDAQGRRSGLSLAPHRDTGEPEQLAMDTGRGDYLVTLGPGATELSMGLPSPVPALGVGGDRRA